MKLRSFYLRSFRVKVTVAFILSMLFVGLLSNFLIYRFALHSQFEQLREKLKIIAQTAALTIDVDTLMQIPLSKEGMNASQFSTIVGKLRKIREVNPPIESVYIMAKTEKAGILQYMVDADIPDEKEIGEGITFYPGDKYDATRFPTMLAAFDAPDADAQLVKDEWGMCLSGYAPIRNAKGEAVAILGVDISANDVYSTQRLVQQRAIFVLFLGIILSLFLGILISERITNPIKKLADGINNIAKGNLLYKVEIKGHDEISELAESFNGMANSLYVTREKLHNYFYNVMEAFVRSLEAKDQYTEGHSRRVAEYSEKIARKIDFDPKEIEMFKEVALLHDIGKLGVDESILTKEGKLTDEEWGKVRKHPVAGEEILKPIALTKELLSVVRGHHERYDGKGYPDHLSGENINMFTSIISIADAYDAMTSKRPYRTALSKEKAIKELEKNRNSQFNGKIVDVFIKILQEES